MTPSIAVIGSGPSGCYAAQFFRRKWPDSEIVIFEALPVPYGLIRYGVAPDHQGNKSVIQQFDRLFEREGVQFVGNVTIGRDIPFQKLQNSFDIVVLATGLEDDRRLDILNDAGDCPIIGAGSLIKALNGHPCIDIPRQSDAATGLLGKRVAVVGNGNVAMDVVRLLCKRNEHLAGSDIADDRLQYLHTEAIERIDVLGRSPAPQAKFDLSMLKEIAALPHVKIVATGVDLDAQDLVSALLVNKMQGASDGPSGQARGQTSSVTVSFHFCAQPEAIRKVDGVNRLTVRQANTPGYAELEVNSVVTAIGFENIASHREDWSGDNIFKVGWLNSGGKGAIAANRRDAKQVTDEIARRFEAGMLCSGAGKGIHNLSELVANKAVPFHGWRKIDDWERANAAQERCRQKIRSVAEMIAVATT